MTAWIIGMFFFLPLIILVALGIFIIWEIFRLLRLAIGAIFGGFVGLFRRKT